MDESIYNSNILHADMDSCDIVKLSRQKGCPEAESVGCEGGKQIYENCIAPIDKRCARCGGFYGLADRLRIGNDPNKRRKLFPEQRNNPSLQVRIAELHDCCMNSMVNA